MPRKPLVRQTRSTSQPTGTNHRAVIPTSAPMIEHSAWNVSKLQNDTNYYLADYDSANNTALWSKYQNDGIIFQTLIGARKFVSVNLSDRKDIILVQNNK